MALIVDEMNIPEEFWDSTTDYRDDVDAVSDRCLTEGIEPIVRVQTPDGTFDYVFPLENGHFILTDYQCGASVEFDAETLDQLKTFVE